MSLGIVVEVALGLILTYLLLSLIGSALQEFWSGFVDLRSKKLMAALERLLHDAKAAGDEDALFAKLKQHALIRNCGAASLPSYIPARNFAEALLHCLRDGSDSPLFTQVQTSIGKLPDDSAIKQTLSTFIDQTGSNLDALRARIELWFDDAMDRLSGDYKRWSRYFMLVFGLVAAAALNVDTIHIIQVLWLEPPEVRAQIVEAAAQVAQAQNPSATAEAGDPAQRIAANYTQLQALPLPVGWGSVRAELKAPPGEPVRLFFTAIFERGAEGFWMVLGWLITALAVSMGAPFWFDMLNKALNMRSSGPKPARADQKAAAG